MNAIYDKLRPKRKYKRKPMCADLNGICTIDKCRCFMGIKVLKKKNQAKLDEHLLHRENVVARIRAKQMRIDDAYNTLEENQRLKDSHSDMIDSMIYAMESKGEWAKRKELNKKYRRMIIKGILAILSIPILYIIIINVLGI